MAKISRKEYDNPTDVLHTEDVSIMGLNPLCASMHPSRQAMHISQMGQILPLLHAERPMLHHSVNGAEDLAITTDVPHDCTVVDIVNKYLILERIDKSEIFMIEIPKFVGKHGKFGFVPVKKMEDITAGTFLKKGRTLTEPPTKDGRFLNSGAHLNVLVATYPGGAEDGCVLNKDTAYKLAYDTVTKMTIPVYSNQILVNMYGNDKIHLGLPKVGSKLGKEGVVCAVRNVTDRGMLGMLTPKALQTTMKGDQLYQQTELDGATILDIEVTSNIHDQISVLGPHVDQLLQMSRRDVDIRQRICTIIANRILHNKRQGIVTREDPYTVNFRIGTELITRSQALVGRAKLSYRTAPAPPFLITVSILRKGVVPTRSGKLVDRSSAKSTITEVRDGKDMPRDRNGVVCDLIVPAEASINRVIVSRDLEQWIAASDVKASDMIRGILGVTRLSSTHVHKTLDKDRTKLSRQDVMRMLTEKDYLTMCMAILDQFSEIVQPVMSKTLHAYMHSDKKSVAAYIADICFHNITIPFSVTYLSQHLAVDICKKLENSKFCPTVDILTGNNYDGSPIDFKYPMLIGPIYYHVLDKDAKEISAASSQTLQAHGLPASRGAPDKYRDPISTYPDRVQCLDSTQILSGALGGAEIVPHQFIELFDRYTSRATQEEEIFSMLSSDHPTSEDFLVDRRKVPYGKSRSLQLFNHLINTHGVEFKYKKPKPK